RRDAGRSEPGALALAHGPEIEVRGRPPGLRMFATEFLDLPPLEEAAGRVVLPGSKSISNRVLLLAALSEGTTVIHDLLDSDDTRVMLDALRGLGCSVVHRGPSVEITGIG